MEIIVRGCRWFFHRYGVLFAYFSCFFLLSLYHIKHGYVLSPDSYTYADWADSLIKTSDKLGFIYLQDVFMTPLYFYLIPMTQVALAKVVFDAKWIEAFFFLNLIYTGLTLYLLHLISMELGFKSTLSKVFLPFMVLISSDFLLWPRYILSDASYVFMVTFSIYLCIAHFQGKFYRKVLIATALTLLLLHARPSSPPVIFVVWLFSTLPNIYESTVVSRYFGRCIFSFIIVAFAGCAWVYSLGIHGLHLPPGLSLMTEMAKMGIVIHDRPETYLGETTGYFSLLLLLVKRFCYFFAITQQSFSRGHNVINIVFSVLLVFPILLSAIIGSKRGSYNNKIKYVRYFLIAFIAGVACYHSMLIIDYDWRYRYPVIVPFIILASIDVEILWYYFGMTARKNRGLLHINDVNNIPLR